MSALGSAKMAAALLASTQSSNCFCRTGFAKSFRELLAPLFVRVAHDQGHRGTIFEEAFRRALDARKFQAISGVLHSAIDMKRELDAAVVIGGELYVFECVSVEKPLDYEIGNLSTMLRRRERLDAKIDQVMTLVEFLGSNPVGTNYDFRKIQSIVAVAVSPFEEWLWDRSERLWLSDETPRVLSAREALELLERARSQRGTGE